jgi:hypothetical protein
MVMNLLVPQKGEEFLNYLNILSGSLEGLCATELVKSTVS